MKQLKSLIRTILGLRKTDTISSRIIVQKYNKFISKHIRTKKYGTNELVESLRNVGIKRGDNIYVHSSWDAFNNYTGKPEEVINAILQLIGNEGTLAMPAYPLIRKKLFDLKKSVTKAGLLPETFRNMPGVVRSANVRQSVCAIGPLAESIVKTHHLSKIRFDECSPFYIMIKNDFKVLSLGMPQYVLGTFVHCVEATQWKINPYFKSFYDFNTVVTHHYIDNNGVQQSYNEFADNVVSRNDYFRNQYIIRRYFDKSQYCKTRLSNLNIGVTNSKYTYDRLCELANAGIVLYIYPRYKQQNKIKK